MTAIVILNIALSATVLLAVVGGLVWSIVSGRGASSRVRHARRTSARPEAIPRHAPLQG